MRVRVVAADIGSVGPPSNFAWVAYDAPGREVVSQGADPESAVSALLPGLGIGKQAALVLESPMSVPVPAAQGESWSLIGKARYGEGNRPWSAGAGAAVLATGLAQGAWMLRRLAAMRPSLQVTTQPQSWQRGRAQLLLAEAFVSAGGKPGMSGSQHAADAGAAGLAFVDVIAAADTLVSDVRCSPQDPFNLLAAMAMWAGLAIDADELHYEVFVISTRTASDQ
jgi:hypothetical protein